MKRFVSALWPPLIPFVIVTLAFEIISKNGWIPSYLMPAPSDVLKIMIDDRDELVEGFKSTTTAAVLGLGASFITGTALAILFSSSRFVKRAVYPYAIFFQTVPIIAIAPLLVIWFGFGRPTVVASAFIVSIFPIVASTLLGLESTDPALVDLFRLYGAGAWARLVKLRLPFALPQILSGLRIASGLSVIGAIVGEFIAGGGLGSIVDAARTQQRIDLVFAAVLASALLGLAMIAFINLIGWLTLRRWHASLQHT